MDGDEVEVRCTVSDVDLDASGVMEVLSVCVEVTLCDSDWVNDIVEDSVDEYESSCVAVREVVSDQEAESEAVTVNDVEKDSLTSLVREPDSDALRLVVASTETVLETELDVERDSDALLLSDCSYVWDAVAVREELNETEEEKLKVLVTLGVRETVAEATEEEV